MGRKGAEFNRRTKEQAKRKWRRKNPGREDEELQVHHKVAVHAGRKLGIPKRVLKSPKNAVAMPAPDHKAYHENEPTLEEYKTIAQGLLGLTQKTFNW